MNAQEPFLANNDLVILPKQRCYMASEHLGNFLMDDFFYIFVRFFLEIDSPSSHLLSLKSNDRDVLQKN